MDKKLEKYLKDYEAHCKRIRQATTVNINETPQEKHKRIKELEKDYIKWFEYYFPNYAKKPCAWFHKRMANLIIKYKIINLLGEIYRSGAKSVHLGMGIPLFLYFTKDLFYMLLIGQTDPKSKKLIGKIQAQLQNNQRLTNDYGRRFKYGDWTNGDFTTTDGVKFKAMSIGQSPRGESEEENRPDYILIDDADTKRRCKNDQLSREAYEWVWEDLRGTFDEGGERQRFIVANNNFHRNTIINQLKKEFKKLIKQAKEFGDEIEHFIISVPAVKNLKTFEPNWPEKTTAKYWQKKYRNTPYRSFMREYMHKHIVEGVIFKNEMILYKKRLQFRQYDGLVVYGDLSYKDKGDFKAMMFMGKHKREYHILKVFNRQSSRALCAEWLYNLYEDWKLGKYNIKYFIEGLFAMDEFVNDFDAEGDKRGYHIPVEADKRSKTDKTDRIESMTGHYNRKSIFIDEALKDDPDTMLYLEHLLAFEKGSGTPDDSPDAQHGAISKLNAVTFVEQFETIITPRKEEINRNPNRF
ncbi:hypothetical protein [Flagellimonas onchidii]|uniref:hypothetical protein n=1 Tax=Flagellimonas onchidii TaxID=2562684 RepID=UPI0010A5D18D|nr:hypothetical protein [Allomuricauda onchidii]